MSVLIKATIPFVDKRRFCLFHLDTRSVGQGSFCVGNIGTCCTVVVVRGCYRTRAQVNMYPTIFFDVVVVYWSLSLTTATAASDGVYA